MFKVLTDSTANLTPDLLAEYDIEAIPFTYTMNGEERLGCDPINFDGKAFYEAMEAGVEVNTSQIPPQRFREAMIPYLEEGRDVVMVSVSSGVSGSCNSARIASEELREEYPDRQIYVVDTLGAALGDGLMALMAVDLARAGKSAEEAFEILNEERRRMFNVFTVDNLKYLRRTGRLSGAAAVVGTLLHIKPILKGDQDGKIVSFEKVRGRKAAVSRLAEMYRKHVRNPDKQIVGITHGNCLEDAEQLAAMVKEIAEPKQLLICQHEPVTGGHVGPGMLALFFLAEDGVRVNS